MIDARTAPYGALLLRIVLGTLFIAHLGKKFFVTGVDVWWLNLHQQGYPDWIIGYTLSVEFAAALLLIPGIYTRLVCLYAIPMMLGAAQYWWARKGFFFTDAGAEAPLLWAGALFVQVLAGDGAYALKSTNWPANSLGAWFHRPPPDPPE